MKNHDAIRAKVEREGDDAERLKILRKHYPKEFLAAVTRREPHKPGRSRYEPHVGGGKHPGHETPRQD